MDERRLSSVLIDFARILRADVSVHKTLQVLLPQVLTAVPADAAAVLLVSAARKRHIAVATDDELGAFVRLQLRHELADPAVAHAARHVAYSPYVAVGGGSGGSASDEAHSRIVRLFPMRVDRHWRGALTLRCDSPTPWSRSSQRITETLSDVLGAYIANAHARSEAHASLRRLEVEALHDPLTGLPNRRLLQDRLHLALRQAQRRKTFVGVLFVDIDGLKRINDARGHDAGDELLRGVVGRLRQVMRPGDTFARFAGDEFVIVCDGLTRRAQAEDVANRMLEALAEPLDIAGMAAPASVSIGIAFAGDGTVTPGEALARADAAMYRAKSFGGGRFSVDQAAEAGVR